MKELEELILKFKAKGMSCVLFDGRMDIKHVMVEAEGRGQEHAYSAQIEDENYCHE